MFSFMLCIMSLEAAVSVQLQQIPDVRLVYLFETLFK